MKRGSRSSAALKASAAPSMSFSSSRRISPSANQHPLGLVRLRGQRRLSASIRSSMSAAFWPLARLAVQHVERVHHLQHVRLQP